jgi:hypothetical protein
MGAHCSVEASLKHALLMHSEHDGMQHLLCEGSANPVLRAT